MLLIALGVCIFVPFSVAFNPSFSRESYYEAALMGVNFIFIIDIIFNFRSATFDSITGEEISHPF